MSKYRITIQPGFVRVTYVIPYAAYPRWTWPVLAWQFDTFQEAIAFVEATRDACGIHWV